MKNQYSFHNVIYQCLFLTLILVDSSSGGLESNIKCRFSQQNQSEFWTGEFVEGNIEFTNSDHQKLKLKRIDVELSGTVVYKSPSTSYRNSGSTSAGHKTFFNQRLNLSSVNTRDDFLLQNDNHKWPFRFFLNDSLPPTLKQKKSSDSFIYYFLQIVFVRSEWYRRNIKKKIPIVVRRVSSPIHMVKVKAQEKNRKDVHLHVILQKSVVAVGKNVSFDVEIHNPKEVLINRITVILAQYLKLGRRAQDRRIHLLNEILWKKSTSLKKHIFTKPFSSMCHTRFHQRFYFHMSSSHSEPPLDISYELRFEAHLNGISTNIQLQLPLIIIDHPQNN